MDEFLENQSAVASRGFVRYWADYLENLRKEKQINISPIVPSDSVRVRTYGGGNQLYSLNRSGNTNTFARPFNMRVSKNLEVGGEKVSAQGLLLNGEPLVNDPANCVKWADQGNNNPKYKPVRYASALLNAVLLYTGSKFKRLIRGCSVDIVVNKSSNEEGGILYYVMGSGNHKTHQNGLDVDISYIKENSPTFSDVVNSSGQVTLSREDSINNLKLLKEFYDTGTINRFIISPHVKANLVKVARQEGELEKYRETLEKAYPYKYHEDHIHLEVVCGTVGIPSNVGCRETDAKHFKWLVSDCNDTTCNGDSDRWVRIVEEDEPETQSRQAQQVAQQPESNQDTRQEDNQVIRQSDSPRSEDPAALINEIAKCSKAQKDAIKDVGPVEDPEVCMPEKEGESVIASFVQDTEPGLELCSWNRWFVEPNICKVRIPLAKSGELQGKLFPECTRKQIQDIGHPIPSDVCMHSSVSSVSNFVEQNRNNGLCMWSMHVCKTR